MADFNEDGEYETEDPKEIEDALEAIATRLEGLVSDLRQGKVEKIELNWSDEGGEIRFLYATEEEVPVPTGEAN